jgi:hypothetical protein
LVFHASSAWFCVGKTEKGLTSDFQCLKNTVISVELNMMKYVYVYLWWYLIMIIIKIINLIYRKNIILFIYFSLYRDSRILHFEENNKLIPFFAMNVPSSVHFGVFN